jgi:integrase/recombinase XerD
VLSLKQGDIVVANNYKNALQNHVQATGKPLSNATIVNRLNTISSLYTFGQKIGYFDVNPFNVIAKPKYDNKNKNKFITNDEVAYMLRAIKKIGNNDIIKKRNFLIVSMLLYTGLRISELCAICWKDFFIDAKNRIGIRIKGKGGLYRSIKIRKELWFYITDYRSSMNMNCSFNNNDTSPLFLNYYGEALTHWYIRKLLSQAADLCGIENNITPHWFRHTSASMALANGADIKKVMTQFGWTNLRTPERYLHDITGFDEAATDFIKIEI